MPDALIRQLRDVALGQINFDDRRFDLRGGPPPSALIESIRRVGVLTPPLLWPDDARDCFVIVIGRRRLRACREADLQTAACLTTVPAAAPLDLLRMAIEDLRASGEMGKLAQGRALRAWERLRPADQPDEEFLPFLGLPPKRGLLEAIRRWALIPADAEQACDEGLLPEAVLPLLAEHPADAREAFLRLFADLGFGVNLQKEALEMIPEIARRDGLSPAEAIQRIREAALSLAGSAADRPRLAEAFRQALRRRRFPRLSAAEERFHGIERDLRLPPGCAIEAPPFFEGREYRFTSRFESIDDLARALRQAAEQISQAGALQDFIDRGE